MVVDQPQRSIDMGDAVFAELYLRVVVPHLPKESLSLGFQPLPHDDAAGEYFCHAADIAHVLVAVFIEVAGIGRQREPLCHLYLPGVDCD